MTTIAFLGLGHMGMPMAMNLVAAGHRVIGFDPSPSARQAALDARVEMAASGGDAAIHADVIITMLPTGRHVLNAYRGSADSPGLLSVARSGTLFIDSSTISVADAREAAVLAVAAGHRALDAPVSGGVVGAERGALAFMVGGDGNDFAAALPLLEAMGERIVHCGDSGLGQAAKICNNMIVGITQIAVAEGIVLGERLGLSHETMVDVMSGSSAQCWALTTNCPVPGPVPLSPANFGFAPGFSGTLMSKDLGLAEEAFERVAVDARLGRMARAIYRDFAEGSGADRDFSAIIDTVRSGCTAT
ncbi:3-hydroxyisobutyrate dehydrogenase [Microbacterium sp. zg.B48]|uniref:3-hydroxyisobutyrate dehydrogenase n=1 Tax=Microbacterium sp. zg.B48 TaxID=2969408 RepID=UPI00214CD419|nr:3-hydroxyisobutyrate dehydrogenase [Microbacterium sp. zg.B48]MCR2764373.1 3-hydroxyisobutyrate dehydrogenase [Microbacterium sp. zg.B48]